MLTDVRHALRILRRAPGFSAIAALTLALGIGANTAIFSVINTVLLTPLPCDAPDRLVQFSEGRPDVRLNVSYPNFLDWRARANTMASMAICVPFGSAVLSGAARAETVATARTEGVLFPLLGVTPAAGRFFSEEEERPGAAAVALISSALWQRRFAGSPAVIGQVITLDGAPVTVVGVLPSHVQIVNADVWYPLRPNLRRTQLDRRNHPMTAYGRLRDGATIEDAQREMTAIAADLEREHPGTNAEIAAFVAPLADALLGRARPMLRLLTIAVGLLLLIACANVANITLARGLRRERETAVRAALGAGRLQLLRLFLAESAVVAAVGCAAGVLLASWSVRALRTMSAFGLPRASEIAVDERVLAYALGVSAVTIVLFGLAPALQLSRGGVAERLRGGGAAAAGVSVGRRLRVALVAIEVALALMLLVGAGLMLRSMGPASWRWIQGSTPGAS
jgi:predicted permease